MESKLIDGRAIAGALRRKVAERVAKWRERTDQVPGLAVVLVGEDPASQVYVRMKQRACEEVGIRSELHQLPATVTAEQVLRLVRRLAVDSAVHGILVQLPLPNSIDPEPILRAVPPEKDVDGFHPHNLGMLVTGGEGMVPCTPAGIMTLIKHTGTELTGKHAVVVGRSTIVGKPTALLLLSQHATVTICHSRTRDLRAEVARADVVVAAVGQPRLIAGDWIKPGAVVIDVGINRRADGGLVGDVEFDSAWGVAGHITPVPGGVGPMTVAKLLENTLRAASMQAT